MMRLIPYAGAPPMRLPRRRKSRAIVERRALPRLVPVMVAPPSSSLGALPIAILCIFAEVAEKHGVTVADIRGSRRTRKLVDARFEVAYRLRAERRASYPQIGNYLGHRDHTSALNAVLRHAERNGLPDPCA